MSTPFFGRLSVQLDRIGFKPPHLFSKKHTRGRVWQKIAALVPLIIISCAAHGWPSVKALSVAVCGALLAEVVGAWFYRRLPAYHEGESFLVGLFCALVLPLTLSSGYFFAAAFISVLIGREIFGGYGQAIIFPPAIGLLILFLGLPQLIQAFDFKEARGLTAAWTMHAETQQNPLWFLYYPESAALEGGSLFALAIGVAVMAGCGLVRWELPLWCFFSTSAARLWVGKGDLMFLMSSGLWLTIFWGLAQTSALPLTPGGRRVYALLAGLLAAVCPIRDEALRMLAGLAAASLIAPWVDKIFMARHSKAPEIS